MLYVILVILAFGTTAELSKHDTIHCWLYNRSRSRLLGWVKYMPILALGIIFKAEGPNSALAIFVGIFVLLFCMIYSHYLDSENKEEKDKT
jgi:hypothetical protein